MRRLSILTLSAILALGCAPLLQGQGPEVAILPMQPVTVTAGSSATFSVTFRITPGYHINSNKPYSDLLIPTQLKLSPPTELMAGKVQYPQGQDINLAAMPEEKLNVYSGTVTLNGMLRAMSNASRGTFRVRGELQYQACSDRQCFPPRTALLDFDVKVVRGTKPH